MKTRFWLVFAFVCVTTTAATAEPDGSTAVVPPLVAATTLAPAVRPNLVVAHSSRSDRRTVIIAVTILSLIALVAFN